MPGFMGFMFWFAFSSVGLEGYTTYSVGIINNDEGIAEELVTFLEAARGFGYDTGISDSALENGFANDFIGVLNTTIYPTEGDNASIRIFNVQEFINLSDARRAIENQVIDGLVLFDPDFSNMTLSAVNGVQKIKNGSYIDEDSNWIAFNGPEFPKNYNSSLTIMGDENNFNYLIVQSILTSFFTNYAESISSLGYEGGNLELEISGITLRDYSIFDTIMPGILVFAVLTQTSMIAAILVGEITETKTIGRIRLSLVSPWEYVLGVTLVNFVLSLIQIVILLGVSIMFLGFNPAGDIFQGIIILMALTLFTTGLGFFFGGVFRSADMAGQSTAFIMTPLAFMSGAFFEIPGITLIPDFFPTAAGLPRDFILWDILPPTHTVNALRSILLYQFTILEEIASFLIVFILGLLLLGVSMVFYTKRRFSGDIS
jgi:ABC-2 type transport system permease protein